MLHFLFFLFSLACWTSSSLAALRRGYLPKSAPDPVMARHRRAASASANTTVCVCVCVCPCSFFFFPPEVLCSVTKTKLWTIVTFVVHIFHNIKISNSRFSFLWLLFWKENACRAVVAAESSVKSIFGRLLQVYWSDLAARKQHFNIQTLKTSWEEGQLTSLAMFRFRVGENGGCMSSLL